MQAGAIEEVALEAWSSGAVLLFGDAAHATSPNMAEGAGMAFEDALVLAETLASAPDVPTALTLFQRRREPRTTWVRTQTHRRDGRRRDQDAGATVMSTLYFLAFFSLTTFSFTGRGARGARGWPTK